MNIISKLILTMLCIFMTLPLALLYPVKLKECWQDWQCTGDSTYLYFLIALTVAMSGLAFSLLLFFAYIWVK